MSESAPAAMSERCRIILRCGDGLPSKVVAKHRSAAKRRDVPAADMRAV
jgi:hypothetical protein